MSGLRSEYEKCIQYLIIPLATFLLFRHGITNLLKVFVVTPVLSNCYPEHWTFDIATLSIFSIVITALLSKIHNKALIPLSWIYVATSYLIVYLYYRLLNTEFEFTRLAINRHVRLLDIISSIPPIGAIYYAVVYDRGKSRKGNAPDAFSIDESTVIASTNDLLNRNKFVQEIATRIKSTETPNASFPIGIVAAWGSGKTTFLNSLLIALRRSDIICIEINVWKCTNSTQIIEAVFQALKEALTPYSFTLNSKIQDYASDLLKGTQNEGLNSLKNVSDLLFHKHNVEHQYDVINKEIQRIGKKVLITIDDLDRLDKTEIYEVIRLIRNTANFAHTFFVVAYDRNYILNAIEEINPYQSHQFLEKIFQLEFILPPISESVLRQELTARLVKILSDKSIESYAQLTRKDRNGFGYGVSDLTTKYVSNIRDVIRFVNSLQLSYSFIRDEVFFPDFYNLELIRFKHPEVFLELYRQRHRFLTTDIEGRNSFKIGTYSLAKVKDTDGSIPELTQFLQQHRGIYKLSNKEIETVVISYSAIFPDSEHLTSRSEFHNSHLSVIKPSMFDRYFFLGIEGKLSEIEFSKMRGLPSQQLQAKLTALCKDETLSMELADRLKQIEEFDNKEDFEKVVAAIFHFANLPKPFESSHPRDQYMGFDERALAKLIGKERNIRFYDDEAEYKSFLLKLLTTTDAIYSFTNDFVSTLIHNSYYDVHPLFSEQQLSDILLINFQNGLAKADKLTLDLWWLFIRCERRQEVPTGLGSTSITYLRDKRAIVLMRKFVLENDLDGFIAFSVRQLDFGDTFGLEKSIKMLFKENDIFYRLLRRCKQPSLYKEEFLRFYEAITTVDEYKSGVPLQFFKTIPVKVREVV